MAGRRWRIRSRNAIGAKKQLTDGHLSISWSGISNHPIPAGVVDRSIFGEDLDHLDYSSPFEDGEQLLGTNSFVNLDNRMNGIS